MKKPLALLLILCLFFSCKKEKGYPDISGTWEIEKTINMSGITNYPAGNGNKIILSGSGGFERRRNDTLLFKGNYSLHHKQDCYSRESDIVITTNEQNNSELYITIENGKLIFDTPNCYTDGALTYYIKQ